MDFMQNEQIATVASIKRGAVVDRPIVFVERPRCPSCSSVELKSLRSVAGDEGTRVRRTKCKDCELTFDIVFE